jgi:hypothetical protein
MGAWIALSSYVLCFVGVVYIGHEFGFLTALALVLIWILFIMWFSKKEDKSS